MLKFFWRSTVALLLVIGCWGMAAPAMAQTSAGDEIGKQLEAAGLRVEVDDSNNRMNAKIRDAQLMKIPYILVVGDKEATEKTVNVRLRTGEVKGNQPVNDFIDYVQDAIAKKALI